MKPASARGVLPGTVLRADVCVVGAGAAGLALARRLDGSGQRVLLLEAGGLERDRATEGDTFAVDHLGLAHANLIESRGRGFGGSTNLWFGRIARPDPIDLEPRPWVPHSGWPLALADLEPWLQVACELLAVPDPEKLDIDRWPRHPTIEAFRREGRSELGVFLWSGAADMGAASRPQLDASTDVEVLLDATATELVQGDGGAIEALAVRRPDGEAFEVRARRYVLAMGGLENPRLLLASRGRSERGVGNERDLVGRYYMEHPRGEGEGLVDLSRATDRQLEQLSLLGERVHTEHGHVQLRITFPEARQRSEELLNHALHAHLPHRLHVLEGYRSARRLHERVRGHRAGPVGPEVRTLVRDAPALARAGASHLRRRTRPVQLVVIDQMEQEPDPCSRVSVDPRRSDRFGLPRLQVCWRVAESTLRSQRVMHELFRDLLADIGVTDFESRVLADPSAPVELLDMKHPAGTTRMAATPATGVVDPDGRVHGVPNLYVAGASTFPTSGHFNPTLTIVALAARLAEHLRGTAP